MPELEPSHDLKIYQRHRLSQFLVVAMAAFSVSALHKLWVGEWQIALAQVVELLCLLLCWIMVRRDRSLRSASALMLWSLTLMVCLLVWMHQGLQDPGMVALAAILVFAGMLGSVRLLLGLAVFMVSVVIMLTVGKHLGWYTPDLPRLLWGTGMDLVLVLVVVGLASGLMAKDLHAMMDRLKAENSRALAFNARLEYLAHFDELTGLANRAAMRQRFEQAAALAERHGSKLALLYLDLDHFKQINDAMGHPAGDALLKALAERLKSAVRRADTVGRLGGDEFLFLLTDVTSNDDLADVAFKLLRHIEAADTVKGLDIGLDVGVTASVGIAVYPQDGLDFDSLLKKADIAMYRAKEEGRNGFSFCDAHINTSVVEHVQLVAGMRQALQKQEFILHYQPQIQFGDGALIGAEALIRWRHPERGLMPPMKFIPVAEKSGQIVEIGAWVLQEACKQAAAWREAGLGDITISVNVSPVQFRRGSIETAVMQALDESGLPARLLELELTESLFIEDSSGLSDSLHRLRLLGVSFSIDDFGTGYSNLGYLRRFEVQRLKIDRSFISRLASNPHDAAIVKAIIQMARSLGLLTIAEGVEDPDMLEILTQMGCDQGQGFYWSRPIPAPDLMRLAQEQQRLKATKHLSPEGTTTPP
jgi:diguanylate cyclase (GGDEF)-like protein